MKCPRCKLEMRITSSRTLVEGDDSPDIQTRVYTEQELSCRNPQCDNFERVVETVRHLVYEGN